MTSTFSFLYVQPSFEHSAHAPELRNAHPVLPFPTLQCLPRCLCLLATRAPQ